MDTKAGFIHLHVHTPYSYLDGASEIDELVRSAAGYGMPALAMTDHNSLTAAIKFNGCCAGYGIKPVFGAEITMEDGSHLTLLASSRAGYSNVCRTASLAHTFGGRLSPALPWDQIEFLTEGVICLSGCRRSKLSRLILQRKYPEAFAFAQQLQRWFGPHLFIELQIDHAPKSALLAEHLAQLAEKIGAPVVATNNVHYATADQWGIHDIKRCIAHKITIADQHPDRPLNSERWLKPSHAMADLFAWKPEAISNSLRIAELCTRDGIMPVDQDITPIYATPNGESEAAHLRELTYEGARSRYGKIDDAVRRRLEDELMLLETLGYSGFVLHAARIVRWARSQGIRVTGRGSGADSIVCYTLRLTDIDVIQRNLPMARWVAAGKKPDVDIDFDARRRDDVFRWVSRTYGADNVALCATYATYWAKGALRDVSKVLAFPKEVQAWFVGHIDSWMAADDIQEAFQRNAELRRYHALADRFALLFELCGKLSGHPRHLGSHSSGLVISKIPLSTLNSVTPSARGVLPIIMLDKDDVESAGAVKIDILSLPILAVVSDAETDIQRSVPGFQYEYIPLEDQATFQMLWTGRSNIGLFQLGSPAQGALAMQLHPRDFEDLVAAIGLIRPGPIKAKAVQKYCAARNGYAPIEYLHPALRPILERTYGVCCFQEQVAYIIAVMMAISDADAEVWRKRLAKHARFGTMDKAREEFVARSREVHRDLSLPNANRIMDELEGWSSLGFVEGHSASFALTGQHTAYMLRHHPVQYYAALLSNQPCGFYEPQTLASEARRCGARLQSLDINKSELSCVTDDEATSIRLGFCLVSGMGKPDNDAIFAARDSGPFRSLLDFVVRVPLHRDLTEKLILCGAFDALHEHTRGLLWRLNETFAKAIALRNDRNPGGLPGLHIPGSEHTPVAWDVRDFSEWDKLIWEWRITGVTTSCHPFAYLRQALTANGIVSCYHALEQPHGTIVTVAGLNLRPHRPPSKSGGRHLFSTLEDESGIVQAAFYGQAIDRCLAAVVFSPVIIAQGIVKRIRDGASLEVDQAWPLRVADYMEKPAEESAVTLSADALVAQLSRARDK